MNNAWILISDARSRLLRIWNIATALLLLFLLIQQITGMIANVQWEVWGWFFISLLPGLLLLNGSAWLRRRSDNVISPGAYRALFWLELLYVVLLFCFFFFSRAAVNMNDYGLDVYYRQSLWILLPFNLLLIAGFVVLFYTRESVFKPSPAVILALAGTKAAEASRKGNQVQLSCYEAIRQNDLPTVFERMGAWFAQHDPDTHQIVIVMNGQYEHLKQASALQTLQHQEAQISLNKLTVGLIDLIGEMHS